MGARRWIDLGVIQLQPSQLMNVALVLALARYFHGLSNEDVGRMRFLIPPALMVLAPATLVLKQPDLGTADHAAADRSRAVLRRRRAPADLSCCWSAAVAVAVPVGWHFLRDYQRNRIYTFLDPESDPLGAGYHILQSKIALGSGGLFGKGFLNGSQSHLSFLPEKQTDFIFTTLAEEFGLVGGSRAVGALRSDHRLRIRDRVALPQPFRTVARARRRRPISHSMCSSTRRW